MSWSEKVKSICKTILITGTLMLTASSLTATTWVTAPGAIQTVYQNGVPHTNKNGAVRNSYDPAISFLPLGIYHAWKGTIYGQTWAFSDFSKAGFNCCHLWEGQRPTAALADLAASANIQLIIHYPADTEIISLRNHSSILAWYLDEEPTGAYWGDGSAQAMANMQAKYDAFIARCGQIKTLDSVHPVFPLDCAWITQPATDWWKAWNTVGDISSHGNYPINGQRNSLSFDIGIPETVSLGVSINNQSKPLWFCTQAHYFSNAVFGCELPTPVQERCMVYTAIIHGATGIIYFGLDSFVLRAANCIGIAPMPLRDYGAGGTVATSDQLRRSYALWSAIVGINTEINVLRPVILSPTALESYEVYRDADMPSITQNPIRTIFKQNIDGGFTLLLVNIDNAAQRVKIRFPNRSFSIIEQFGNLGYTESGDSFQIDCPAYDVRVFRIMPMAVSELKNLANGTSVCCYGAVSAVFNGYFYMQSTERTSGIRVVGSSCNVAVGQIVTVSGMLNSLDSNERYISAQYVR